MEITSNVYSRKEKVGFGAKIMLVINGIVSNDVLGKFALDFCFRVEDRKSVV